MVEWHQPPDYIVDNWTDELLDLMLAKLIERKQKEIQAIRPPPSEDLGDQRVPDSILFSQAGNLIKVVKKP